MTLPAVTKPTALATEGFTPDQIALIKRTVCPGANDDEMKLFLYVANRTGLDPFARQIYAVKRKDKTGAEKMVIQTSIDGFRLTASRTGAYAGRDEAVFEYDTNGNPIKCKVTVYKIVQGVRAGWTATAKWSEYYPGDSLGFMWKKLPETMLEKCCEAKALRMAFPAELSTVYSQEEMDQADRDAAKIGAQQPEAGDGVPHDLGYRIPAGKYAKRALEEVKPEDLRNYVQWMEDNALKAKKPLDGWAKEFVERASAYLGDMENGSSAEGDDQ